MTFGEKLRDQVEERLAYYETGALPRKNITVMKEAITESEQSRLLTLWGNDYNCIVLDNYSLSKLYLVL